MMTSQVFALVSNSLALVTTLSVILLLIFQRTWRERISQVLFQFLGSLAILQSGTLLTHVALLAEMSDPVVSSLFNITLIGFFLTALTGLAVLLHMANAMKDAWAILARSGVAALVVIQPALWSHDLFRFHTPLDEHLMGSPYTLLGKIMVGLCLIYVALLLFAGWRYWEQIGAPFLVAPIMALAVIQVFTMMAGSLREIALTGAMGGIVSVLLGYYLIDHLGLDPRTSHARWMKALCSISQILGSEESWEHTLTGMAEQARHLIRADIVSVLQAVDSERLEIVALTQTDLPMLSRQIRVGEGLAGRVMQTLSSMRIDNYQQWDGRSPTFDEMPLYASISVPLIYHGRLVGVVNAHETTPGRVFTNRDQTVLEVLAPQAAVTLVAARLEHDLQLTGNHFRAVMAHLSAAVMIFDSSGMLKESNPAAQNYLHTLFGESANPITVTQWAARAQGEKLLHALARWMADPTFTPTLEAEFSPLGRRLVDLRTITTLPGQKPDLLVMMRSPEDGPTHHL